MCQSHCSDGSTCCVSFTYVSMCVSIHIDNSCTLMLGNNLFSLHSDSSSKCLFDCEHSFRLQIDVSSLIV